MVNADRSKYRKEWDACAADKADMLCDVQFCRLFFKYPESTIDH